jgi:NADPH:quinone reductase-like Zn-dependent oxidoreductase
VSLRAAGIETYGAEVRLLELPEPPPPGDGEVLIEVEAAGVANWDDFVRTGGWDVGRTPPLALGVEAAGGVIGVGPGVQWPATGAAVMTHPLPLPYQGVGPTGWSPPPTWSPRSPTLLPGRRRELFRFRR